MLGGFADDRLTYDRMSPMQAEPYFWEEGGNPNADWWAKVRHAVHFGSIKAIAGAEAVGEVNTSLSAFHSSWSLQDFLNLSLSLTELG